ncbi:MAG: MBL fold metallo-hydrolase, partial [Bacteroidota bacterium]
LHTGDIFHHPGFDLEHPEWATAFDQDTKKAYYTRKRILDMASHDQIFLMSYHMPFPALGHVYKKGSGYGWVDEPWILSNLE